MAIEKITNSTLLKNWIPVINSLIDGEEDLEERKADKATTLAGYGITDAKIENGVITLGTNTITPLTSTSTISAEKITGTLSNATVPGANVSGDLTNATINGSKITGTITTAKVVGSNVTGTLTSATVPGSQVSGDLTNATINGSKVTETITTAKVVGSNVTGTLTSATVPGSQVSGALSNATIAGSSVTGTINTAKVVGSNVTGTLSNATVPTSKLSGSITASTISPLTGYTKATTSDTIATTDSLLTALGKLEKQIEVKDTLPSQSGNSGKYLTTNGTIASWSEVDSLPDQTDNSGKYLTTNGTIASWSEVDSLPDQTGNDGKLLTTNGTVASWTDLTIAPSAPISRGKNITTSVIAVDSTITLPNSLTYKVGSDNLEVYANSLLLTKGIHYNEIGTASSDSSTIQILFELPVDTIVEFVIHSTVSANTLTPENLQNLQTTNKQSLVGAINELKVSGGLPEQAGNAGKYLTTDGNTASWSEIQLDNYLEKSGGVMTGSLQTKGEFGTPVTVLDNVINPVNGCGFSKNITANTSFAFGEIPESTCCSFILILKNGGNYTVSYPSSVKWTNGVVPTLSTSGEDVLSFFTINGGVTWYGSMVVLNAAVN